MTIAPPVVKIDLDKTRTLKMDFAAIAYAEAETGKNFLVSMTWMTLNARDKTTLLWACLLHEDPSLTLEQVRGMVNFTNHAYVTEKIIEARDGALPEPEDTPEASAAAGEGDAPVPLARKSGRAGKTSSPSASSTTG